MKRHSVFFARLAGNNCFTSFTYVIIIILLIFVFSELSYSLHSFVRSSACSLTHSYIKSSSRNIARHIACIYHERIERKRVMHSSQKSIMLRTFGNEVRLYLIMSSFACYKHTLGKLLKRRNHLGACMLSDLKLFAHSHCE